MKKKSLLILLTLPLLVTACGTNEDSSSQPGEWQRGEDVLTAAQKQKMFVSKTQGYQLDAKLVSEFEIDTTLYSLESETTDFSIYRKGNSESNTTEWNIYSKVKGKVASAARGQGYSGSTTLAKSTYTLNYGEGTVIPLLYYHADFASASYTHSVNDLVDVFGNKLWSANKKYADEHITNVSAKTYNETVYRDNVDKTVYKRYAVEITSYNFKESKTNKKRVVYKDGFTDLGPYQEEGSGINKIQTFMFDIDNVQYSGAYAASGLGINIAYKDKEGKNASHFVNTTGLAGCLIGHNYIYQTDVVTDKHNADYTYADTTGLHVVKTYSIDLSTNKTVELAFPYKLVALSIDDFLPEHFPIVSQYTLPNLGVARLRKIQDKHLAPVEEKYVVDGDLILHDDLRVYNAFKKLGSHYINGKGLYDENFNYLGDIKGFSVDTTYPKCLLVERENTGDYGVMDENGKLIVEAKYSNATKVDGLIVLSEGEEVVYFDPYALKAVIPNHGGSKINNTLFARVQGEPDEEDPTKFGNDKFYYLDKMLLEVEHFDSLTNSYKYTFVQDGSTYKYLYVSFNNEDGNPVRVTFMNSVVEAE